MHCMALAAFTPADYSYTYHLGVIPFVLCFQYVNLIPIDAFTTAVYVGLTKPPFCVPGRCTCIHTLTCFCVSFMCYKKCNFCASQEYIAALSEKAQICLYGG